MSEVLKKIKAIKKKVKHGKLKYQKKDIKKQVLKGVKDTDAERKEICKKAREKAHTIVADTKRDMSNEIRKNLHSLSEGFDFIEESLGSGNPEFTFYEEPQESTTISESFTTGENRYGMIGIAEGVFAPIGVMSRNNRIYDEDHYDYILENELIKNKIATRGMLGTIGHHDKRVDDVDLANGDVSHIVTDLHIQEEADGTRNLVGRLEIMDTPAGRLLKTYYEHGIPLYVSSRGAGKLLNVANENYKRVDKTNYFLETFDVVKDPGFLQAKPNYVKESLEEDNEELNNTIGENNMENEKVIPAIDTKMDAEEIVNKLLHPLQEQLAELTETVKLLSEKVLDEACEEEKTEEAEEEKHEEEKVEEAVSEEVETVEEACEEKAEEKEETEAPAEEEKVEEAVEEAVEEVIEEVEAVEEACEEEPTEETEDDEKEEPVEEACEEEKEEAPAEEEKEEPVEEAHETAEEERADAEQAKEIVDKAVEIAKDAAELADKETEEAEEIEKAEAVEESVEEVETVEEACEEKAEEKEEPAEEEKVEEAVEEVIDYEAKFKESEAVMNDLVKMVSETSARSKALVEKYESAMKELNAYKLSEELAITVDEAKEKLEAKSYEEIVAESKEEVEAPAEEIVEEVKEEPVVESKKAVKPVFSKFSGLNESKKSGRKGFSIFG